MPKFSILKKEYCAKMGISNSVRKEIREIQVYDAFRKRQNAGIFPMPSQATPQLRIVDRDHNVAIPEDRLAGLRAIEKKALWLSAWMIHNANHLRPARDGLKVGGHQSSCASSVTLLTALYMDVLKPADRVAVKPHASPVYHALMYLLGKQSREKMENFRGLGGAQSYPSRTKDADDVDFSTGSVGLGVGLSLCASLVQDYVEYHKLMGDGVVPGKHVALMGDAELDEGNVFEALLEGWKHDVRNLWWVVDYNRQSLDGVVNDLLFQKIQSFFGTVGWNVVTLKYGKKLEAAREGPAGEALLQWIDDCPNDLYSALTYKAGAAWRKRLQEGLSGTSGLKELLDSHDDDSLHALMTNLAGHDMETVLEAFHTAPPEQPTCFVAYTIKGHRLPFAGHKDNHAGLMNPDQMAVFQKSMGIGVGEEWAVDAGLGLSRETLDELIAAAPFNTDTPRRHSAPAAPVPERFAVKHDGKGSTQQGFGQIMNDLGRSDGELAKAIVTTSPDVTVSTNLGGWVNQRGLFDRKGREDVFKAEDVASAQKWVKSQTGQHIELGIAENNLFLMLTAMGLSESLFGARLLPVGTLYDPFINRGLDSLFYGAYQDSRFMVVSTPSGITLAPEGGAHQSVNTPLTAMVIDRLAYFEPAFLDELGVIMAWGFRHMQAPANEGGSVYLRLSTRPLAQPKREMTPDLQADIEAGAYWLKAPAEGADIAIAFTGAVAPEAIEAHEALLEDAPGAGLLAVTSPDRLHQGWLEASRKPGAVCHLERLLKPLARDAAIVTVIDGHPATLSWLGSVGPYRIAARGVETFGQSGDIDDLYKAYGLDAESILDAAAAACLKRLR
jgi:pyruvate dehydrogenase E1 component